MVIVVGMEGSKKELFMKRKQQMLRPQASCFWLEYKVLLLKGL